jgi:hypothetical protein
MRVSAIAVASLYYRLCDEYCPGCCNFAIELRHPTTAAANNNNNNDNNNNNNNKNKNKNNNNNNNNNSMMRLLCDVVAMCKCHVLPA